MLWSNRHVGNATLIRQTIVHVIRSNGSVTSSIQLNGDVLNKVQLGESTPEPTQAMQVDTFPLLSVTVKVAVFGPTSEQLKFAGFTVND